MLSVMNKNNPFMKNFPSGLIAIFLNSIGSILAGDTAAQQSSKDKKMMIDCDDSKAEFIKADGLMKDLFENAYAYVLFPNVGKGGLIVGGAIGNGIVYRKGEAIGKAKLTQLTAGFQGGGQSFREVIFFEHEQALNRFMENKVEFSAGVSAVVAKEGAAARMKYQNGVMVFTHVKGGLMIEASVGGQKFNFQKF
jgi:lipid-binding SYLF domain-containing protein